MAEHTQDIAIAPINSHSNSPSSVSDSSNETLVFARAFAPLKQNAVDNPPKPTESASTSSGSTLESSHHSTSVASISTSLDSATVSHDASISNSASSKASVSSRKKQKNKGGKPGNPGNFLGEYLVFLQSKAPEYLELKKSAKAQWFKDFKAEWFIRYPWHTQQEPSEEELQEAVEANGNNESVDDLRDHRQKEVEKNGVAVGCFISLELWNDVGLQVHFFLL